jgi:hypothetical protein
MSAHKEPFRRAPLIEVWVPAVGAMQVPGVRPGADVADRLWDPQPAGWPHTIFDALNDLLDHSAVGRAVIRNLMRRTTIYYASSAQTDADSAEPYRGTHLTMPNDLYREASNGLGWAAMIMINSMNPPRLQFGVHYNLRLTLLHELVHAVTVTNGAFRVRSTTNCEQSEGSSSLEETFAWIIDNMHRSEMQTTGRHRYTESRPLVPNQAPSPSNTGLAALDVIERNHVHFAEMRLPDLARDLRRIGTVSYNPFRDRAGSRSNAAPDRCV